MEILLTFDIEGTREGDAITSPSPTIRSKVNGLSGTGSHIWTGKVITTANKTRLSCTSVLGREIRVLVAWNAVSAFNTTIVPRH